MVIVSVCAWQITVCTSFHLLCNIISLSVVQYMKGTMTSKNSGSIEVELQSIRLHENRTSVSSLPEDNGLEV